MSQNNFRDSFLKILRTCKIQEVENPIAKILYFFIKCQFLGDHIKAVNF